MQTNFKYLLRHQTRINILFNQHTVPVLNPLIGIMREVYCSPTVCQPQNTSNPLHSARKGWWCVVINIYRCGSVKLNNLPNDTQLLHWANVQTGLILRPIYGPAPSAGEDVWWGSASPDLIYLYFKVNCNENSTKFGGRGYLSFRSKSLNLSNPIFSAGYSEIQMRLLMKHFNKS